MGTCDDCRATTAFQAWHSVDLTPSFNVSVSFDDWKIAPKGKRAVIELVTAQIIVPRRRMGAPPDVHLVGKRAGEP